MSLAVSDVRSQIRDLPKAVGVAPETPRAIGTGDGVNTVFYLPVGSTQYYGTIKPAQVFVNGVAAGSGAYTVDPSGLVSFGIAPTAGATLTATYQVTGWNDVELSNVLTRNELKYGSLDDQTVLKGCTLDLIDQLLMNTELLAYIREDTYMRNPMAVVNALIKLKGQLMQELTKGPRPGQNIPWLQMGVSPTSSYTPRR